MGTLFRSQEMALCQFFLQSEAAYCCTAELGEIGAAQFRDLNKDVNVFQRKFVNEIRRCDDMERVLRFLEKECQKEKVPVLRLGENPTAPLPRELVDLESTLEKLEKEMKEVNVNFEALKRSQLELLEMKYVLKKAQQTFELDGMAVLNADSKSDTELLGFTHDPNSQVRREAHISFLAGTIPLIKVEAFERLVWRLSRGTVLLRTNAIEMPLEDPHTGDEILKATFFAFYQGENLRVKIRKVCEAFHAAIYPVPDSPPEIREMSLQVMTRIEDLKTLIGHTQQHRHMVLLASAKNLDLWEIKVQKIKAVYAMMNCFNIDTTQRCFIGEAWVPHKDMEAIRLGLLRGSEKAECSVPSFITPIKTIETPPTYHKTSKFTSGFQAIVDAYGVSTYREVNPAPFTVITFPFLFAVMFGDAGHGLIMTCMAGFLLWKEKTIMARRDMGEITATIFGGRYIIFLMGLFSIYTGLIYNDIFSKSFNIFGSRWYPRTSVYNFANASKESLAGATFPLDPTPNALLGSDYRYDGRYSIGGPYPFGIDPAWALASNKINFINSYKMKMSVIFGVLQMAFGIVLSCFNHTYFKRRINIICEFLPQMIFLTCMFGYLVILIFYKWTKFDASTSGCSPSLLIGLINMFLMKNEKNPQNPDGTECRMFTFYNGQKTVETALVVIAFLCFPWMLLSKPLYQRWRQGKVAYSTVRAGGSDSGSDASTSSHNSGLPKQPEAEHGHGQNESFADVMIYQGIHTIEFCLGVISNTASYLRLWALSLAHSQLSEVLWTMAFRKGFMMNNYGGIFLLLPVFALWACATFSILICMEGMSAFLHALRLHWVEFQNKFYQGTGHAFEPFDFKKVYSAARLDQE